MGAGPTNHLFVDTIRVLNEVIVADADLPALLDAVWWLAPEAIRLEDSRYLIVLEVACDDASLAPGYCRRRLHKAATDLGLPVATGDVEVVGLPAIA